MSVPVKNTLFRFTKQNGIMKQILLAEENNKLGIEVEKITKEKYQEIFLDMTKEKNNLNP